MIKDELNRLISEKRACVGVIGLGYVGLPLIVEFCLKGFEAIGFEVDETKTGEINAGRSYIVDVTSENVKKCVDEGRLTATTDFSRLSDCDVIIICVPTPLRKTKDPDMSYILTAGGEIQNYMRRGQLIILESTTYPGTTDEVLLPMFEEKGFKLDEDFLLAFSPERVDPGNPQFQTHNIPKVVGGVSDDSTDVSTMLYGAIVGEVYPVSSARVAEAAKLWENTFRAINIGMANEMAKLCNALGIDTWEVVRAAATKPFGFMAFYPGPGIGGHCIPLDPHYLSWKARQHGFDSQFISLAEQVNSNMPAYVVELVTNALNNERKPVNGSKVLILGVAYKKDIDDMRESPALSIIDLLRADGAEVYYHDPFVPEVTFDHAYTIGDGEPLYNKELTDDLIAGSDCIIICTEHSPVDYGRVCELASLIVDTRNALSLETRGGSNARIVRLLPLTLVRFSAEAMLKVLNIAGARPNFMKVAPIYAEMKRRPSEFAPMIVHTGQHYDAAMSDAFFDDLGMPKPDIYLGVGSASHAVQTAKIMTEFEPVVLAEKPDWVLVVGDVNSTIACALVCAKLGIKVAHVEAGLRSRDRAMPEEINRILTDSISDMLFTTSQDADENLRHEGIPAERVKFVGNVMIDSLLDHLRFAGKSTVRDDLGLNEQDYAVATLHRPSNVDEKEVFSGILEALLSISQRVPIIFPVHPRTRAKIEEFGLEETIESSNIRLIDPLGYLDFMWLYSGASLVLTDSGGLQEETTVLGIPCLTLRHNTERPITVEMGTNVLVGTDATRIIESAFQSLADDNFVKDKKIPPLWDGKAAGRICDELRSESRL